MIAIEFTMFSNIKNTNGMLKKTGWSDLCGSLQPVKTESKTAVPLWAFKRYMSNRKLGEPECYTAVMLDIDNTRLCPGCKEPNITSVNVCKCGLTLDAYPCKTLEEAVSKLSDVLYLAHDTYSNTLDWPKFRIILPLSTPIICTGHYQPFCRQVVAWLGLDKHIDYSCIDNANLSFFMPSCANGNGCAMYNGVVGGFIDSIGLDTNREDDWLQIKENESIYDAIARKMGEPEYVKEEENRTIRISNRISKCASANNEFDSHTNSNSNSNINIIKHSSGNRNNKLKDIATASLYAKKTLNEIVCDVMHYDELHHELPLFQDRSEYRNPDPMFNACKFVKSIAKSLGIDYRQHKMFNPDLLFTNNITQELPAPAEIPIETVGHMDKQGYDTTKSSHDTTSHVKTTSKSSDNRSGIAGDDTIGCLMSKLPMPDFPEGLVGDIARWIVSASNIPQPGYALAAALTFVGAIKACKYRSSMENRTNIYTVAIGASSSGKDGALKAIKRLATAAGCDKLLRGQPKSAESLTDLLDRQIENIGCPAALCQLDELGTMMESWFNSRNASWATGVPGVLMQLWSAADSIMATRELASRADGETGGAAKILVNPTLCIYGTSTPAQFIKCLTSHQVLNGFLPRWLFFKSVYPIPEFSRKKRQRDILAGGICIDPPIDIIQRVQELYNSDSQNPRTIQFTEDALDFVDEYDMKSCCGKDHESYAEIINKAKEQAMRLALIVSGSIIDVDIMRWACDTVRSCLVFIVALTKQNLADNNNEAEYKRVLNLIVTAGKEGIGAREITRKTQWLANARRRSEILNDIANSENIYVEKTKIRNTIKVMYKYLG